MAHRLRRLAIAAAVIALVATTVTTAVVLAAGTAKTYTGCLQVSGWTLTLIKDGD